MIYIMQRVLFSHTGPSEPMHGRASTPRQGVAEIDPDFRELPPRSAEGDQWKASSAIGDAPPRASPERRPPASCADQNTPGRTRYGTRFVYSSQSLPYLPAQRFSSRTARSISKMNRNTQ